MNLGTYTWYLLLINVVNWVAGFWFGRWYEQRQSRQTQEPRIPIPKFLTDAFRETVQRSMVAEETSSGRLVRQSGVVTAVDPAAQEATVSFMVVGHRDDHRQDQGPRRDEAGGRRRARVSHQGRRGAVRVRDTAVDRLLTSSVSLDVKDLQMSWKSCTLV